jgi:hypothetical protein
VNPELKAAYLEAYGFDYDHMLDHRDGLDVETEDYPDDEFLIDWTEDWLRMTEPEAM